MVTRLLAIFLIWIAISPAALAYDPEFSKIISYSKLMSLPPAKRAEYVQQVRYIQMEFEEIQKNLSNDKGADVADAAKERNFFLEWLIQDANAATKASWFWSAYDASLIYRCDSSLQATHPHINSYVKNEGAKLACLPRLIQGCPPGYTDLEGDWKGKRVCFKPGVRRAAQQAAKQRAESLAKAPPQVRAEAERKQKAARIKFQTESKAKLAKIKNPKQHLELSAEGATVDHESDLPSTQADEDTFHKVLDLPPYTIAKNDDGSAAQLWAINPDRSELKDQTCKDAPDINPPPETCNEETVKAAKRTFYRTGAPHCIYAGNLSHYANREKRPGNCQIPHEFCLTRITCRDENNALKTNENIVIKCESASQVICNPYIFNLDENDKALCVTPGPDATAQCNKRADEVKEKVGADHYFPFVTRVKLNNVSDTKSEAALSGIQEGWDNFADEMNKLCFESPSKDLYCRECAILKRRVADLNLATLSSKAPDANGNCYYFRHLNTHGTTEKASHSDSAQ